MNVQPTNSSVDRIFQRYAAPGSPGCAIAVVRDGQMLYKQGYGLANLEHNVPNLPSTVFNIGSAAKQFTAFGIALLEAEGRISLDDDVRTHLPELWDFGHVITLRHLVHHTSGLRGSFPELLALAEWRDTDTTTTEDVFWLLRQQRELNYHPGEEHLYVNSGYVLLALICQRVSGQPFGTFCHDRIFGPLGMERTVVNDSIVTLIPGRAGGYYEDEGSAWFVAPLTDTVVGSTNVYSTVEALARWDENFYTGGVGGTAVVERMHQPGRLNDGTELDYAFGLMVGPTHQHRGWDVVEHGGSQGGYSSWMVRFPEQHLSVIVLFNHFMWEMRDYALRVADIFVEDRSATRTGTNQGTREQSTEAAPIPPPAIHSQGQLERMAGTYYSATCAALREVGHVEGKLQYQGLDLVPIGEHRFCFEVEPDTHVAFTFGPDGWPSIMTTITPSGEYTYERVERVSPDLDPKPYVGRYYSQELDLYWTLVEQGGSLIAKRRKYVTSTLTPLFHDAFSDDWLPIMGYPTTYLVVFERDAQGAVSGFRVSGTRVRNLAFSRVAS